MINENAYDAFVSAADKANLIVIDNDVDLFVFPNISDSLAEDLSDHFGLHVDEEILYVRDTSFWNDHNQGTVVTDWGITIVPDNDKPDELFQFEWKDIDHFEYRNKKLLLFSSESRNDNIPIDISLFHKETDDDSLCRTNGEVLADIFTMMAQSCNDPSVEAYQYAKQLIGTKPGSRNTSGGVDHWMADASGSYSKDFSSRMIEELAKSISLHQTFQPYAKPAVPDGLVWYQNEPSWQRLVSQRLNGNLLLHEERIETRKSQMVESREMSEIKGEFESLLLDMNIEMTKNDEQQFVMQENAILSIHVKFAPMTQLTSIGVSQAPQIPADKQVSKGASSKNEKEYLEYYKDILEDYDEVSPRERKRLEKDRIRLGISEARARELEDSCAQIQLTEKEKEYQEEYQEMLEDYGSISDRERKRLDKIRIRLGISKERAREIEKKS